MKNLWKEFPIEIPEPLDNELEEIASKKSVSKNDLICEILREELERKKHISILIVDDDDGIRALLKEYIRREGIGAIVGEATNGQEAVKMYEKFHPSIVLLDVLMPLYDGVQTLKDILFYDPRAKVIMVSVINDLKCIIDFMKVGACNYIVKPFKKEALIKIIVDTMYSNTYQNALNRLKRRLEENLNK